MAFDAHAFAGTYRPPVYIDRSGKTHTGLVLSRFQFLPIEDDARTVFQGTPEEQRAKCERVLAVIFPAMPPDIVAEICDLPAELLDEAMGDFFGCQSRPKPTSGSPAGAATAGSS